MTPYKLPPIAKVYEALSAVVDGRVKITEGGADVKSSGGDKTYVIRNHGEGRITSSDPASRFQGYVGYPIIAYLLQSGSLTYDSDLVSTLGGVHWKVLNDRFKRDYDAAVDHVLAQPGLAEKELRAQAELILGHLAALNLRR